MGSFAATNVVRFLAAAMIVVAMVEVGAGQQSVPQCAQKLLPCANYLGSSKPPESCCGPVKEAVKNELQCLCSLFNSPELLKAFNINVTQALALPKNCGIQSDQSMCNSISNSTSPGKGSYPIGDRRIVSRCSRHRRRACDRRPAASAVICSVGFNRMGLLFGKPSFRNETASRGLFPLFPFPCAAPSSTSTSTSPTSQTAKPAGSAAAQLSWAGVSGLVGLLWLCLTIILA
ncbi:Lipid transfer-like protein VAS [Apostasia shenzhenica]|uniref:Lipid transfer-like protein VAS n=1 Tax=Apostasia shenzhenica TaxID=1088818 RepID=A0A2I0AYV1_9ASPA|nr:Lipid transfer-like protein VAS [Apostasia shenzhenica]